MTPENRLRQELGLLFRPTRRVAFFAKPIKGLFEFFQAAARGAPPRRPDPARRLAKLIAAELRKADQGTASARTASGQ